MGIHDQMWLWTLGNRTKCVYRNRDIWPTVKINLRWHGQVSISIWNTWPSEKSNTGIHDQVWISTVEYMTMCKYKHWHTWQSVNINMGTHNQVTISAWVSMTKWEYQHKDIWWYVSINMEQYYQLYQHRNILKRENIDMGTHNLVWISKYQNGDTWLSGNENMVIHD